MEEEYREEERKGKHLSAEERGKIEAYRDMGYSISRIARELGRAKSTISVEVRQGKYHGSYRANVAQNRAVKRRKESHKHSKWKDCELQSFILKCLKKRWSPEVISATWKRQTGQNFSHTSLYTLIKKHRPEWKNFLICRGKRRKLTHSVSVGKIPNRVEIAKRPEIVASRQRFGDYEADTVYSCRGGKSCLAVFVERQSRLYLLAKMKDKSANAMYKASRKLLKNKLVKTITYDNGTENVLHEKVNNLLNCNSFFCNPYHSWEKGAIENRNKILRQFFPKGTNFDLISNNEIRRVQSLINNRPMKALNWLSPAEAFVRYRSVY